jgi:hypothetical protein
MRRGFSLMGGPPAPLPSGPTRTNLWELPAFG